MEPKGDIALIGLAVMGQNLILNMNDHGFTVVAYNRTVSKVDDFMNVGFKPKYTVHRGKGKVATMDVPAAAPDGSPRPRAEIDAAVGAKRAAEAALVARFGSGPGAPLTADEVARVVASVGDAGAYAAANERPVDKMLQLLTDNFSPVGPAPHRAVSSVVKRGR